MYFRHWEQYQAYQDLYTYLSVFQLLDLVGDTIAVHRSVDVSYLAI